VALVSPLLLIAAGMRALRWRVWGALFLIGLPLATLTGHALALGLGGSRGETLLLDAAGLAWGVVADGLGLAALALGQLVGVDNGRISLARSLLPAMTGGMAAVLLGVEGWLEGVGLVGAVWFLWFGFVAVVAFLGGIRYDTSARHHGGRVLLGFLVVAGTVLVAVTLDHVVLGLGAYAMDGVSDARRAAMEIDALYLRSGVRKMSFVAVVLSLLLAGSASQGSMGPASDARGSLTALVALAGLLTFVAFEAWLSVG
jgi:hypothetical protein